jgi:tetratricopeptide (TPR) repeat protein
MIGTVLNNRYKLIAELGKGGMAWVYLAEDLRDGQQVAVKILYPQLGQDVGFLQRFHQEAKLVMALSQSDPQMHIARVLDYGSARDTHYLVMEYVKGQDLRRVLEQEGPLPWQEALDITRQVALALGHAHQHGIVHRDVKPENIMILPDGTVRVLDFGVARARTSPTLTGSGFVGSPFYVAPEQAMGRRVDTRADLYSLGIVLYEMLTGDRPFQSDTPWAVMNHHIATPPPPLEETCPDLPRPVARLVHKTINKRPEDRFQTPAEMVQAVEAVLGGLDHSFESSTAAPDMLASLLDELYGEAQRAAQAGEWADAVDLFSQVLRLDPRYLDVTDQLAEAGRQARLAALYTAAQQAIKREQWADGLSELDEIVQMTTDYRDVKNLRARVMRKYELVQLYAEGVRHLEAGEWAAAIQFLTLVYERDPGYAQTANLLATARAEQGTQGEAAAPAGARRPARRLSVPPRRRRLIWAALGLLLAALTVGSYLLFHAQQPPVSASVSELPVPATSTAASQPARTATTTPPATASQTLALARTPTPGRTWTPSPAQILAPSPTVTPTITPTLTASPLPYPTREPPLVGQIAFPCFDPVRGSYDVYVCRIDGSACQHVAAEASQPDLLPDGSQVVLHSWKAGDKGLILQTLSGQRIWKITGLDEAARPSSDWQGDAYAFQSRQESDRQPRLYRTYGPDLVPIKQGAGAVLGHSPAWLPDGRILYSGCWQDSCGILVMYGDGSYPRQVAAGNSETNPEASPDGQQVAFMSQRDGNWEVYVVNLDGSGLRRLTRDPADDGLPCWSPDGRYLAFVSNRDGSWAVWIMRPDGSGQRRLFGIGGPLDGQVRGAPLHESHGWVEERISWSPLP